MSTELVKLRYTGKHPQTFLGYGIGSVEENDEFDVPADALLSFMRRADVEHAGECPQPPCTCGEESEPEPPAPQEAESGTSGKPKGGRRGGAPSTQDAQG